MKSWQLGAVFSAALSFIVFTGDNASAITLQPGDVAKFSYDLSSILPPATPVDALELEVTFGPQPWGLNKTVQFQFFNSTGTTISSVVSLANGFGNTVGNVSFPFAAFTPPVDFTGYVLFESVDGTLDISTAIVFPFFQNHAYPDPNGFGLFADTEISPAATPLPAALPLFATGLGALGLIGWRRKKKAAAFAA
jgi:hypothetical protein